MAGATGNTASLALESAPAAGQAGDLEGELWPQPYGSGQSQVGIPLVKGLALNQTWTNQRVKPLTEPD